MGKNKWAHFEENKTFSFLFQPPAGEMYTDDFEMKGKWKEVFFKNNRPIVLEVGCGKGEYTTGLALKNPQTNYIGIDIKGNRLWRAGKTITEAGLTNVALIRNKVEFLNSFFAPGEIDEIWITFPDPQRKKAKKRLTSARFLEIYKKILQPQGKLHLKTDSGLLYDFSCEIANLNNLKVLVSTDDLYASDISGDVREIQTFYENTYLKAGKKIHYLQMLLNTAPPYKNPDTKPLNNKIL